MKKTTEKTATFSLSRDAKAKWLKALRSGKYRQGRGALYREETDAFCCLGVLCMTQGAKKADIDGENFPLQFGLPTIPNSWRVSVLGFMYALSELNDAKELPFSEIADIIEEQVPCHD